MHSAPAVSYPVGRSFFYGALLVGIHVIGASVLLAWVVASDAPRLGQVLGGMLWLASVAVAMLSWWRSPTGTLTWDGQHWIWADGEESHPVTLSVTLDIQNLMLMYLGASEVPKLWVWLERRSAPTRWRAYRRAVFARQPADQARDVDWVAQ
jgi:hypothetical protein